MYKTKPVKDCEQPFPQTDLKVLMLNASLKHKSNKEPSNTGEVCELVLKEMMNENQKVLGEIIRLSDKNIPVGLNFRESEDDEWQLSWHDRRMVFKQARAGRCVYIRRQES